jgi:hypothetical protein
METALAPTRPPGRWLIATGFALTVLGIGAYAVQIAMHRLFAPWYLPVLGTLAVVLLVVAYWQKRSLSRALALSLVTLMCMAEWGILLGSRLPPYAGPLAVGQPFPAFTTQTADGTTFTQQDLAGEQKSVLVFFRGRW